MAITLGKQYAVNDSARLQKAIGSIVEVLEVRRVKILVEVIKSSKLEKGRLLRVTPEMLDRTGMKTKEVALGDAKGINALIKTNVPGGKVITKWFLTNTEGRANKYHYFALVQTRNGFVGCNVYGRIGVTGKYVEITTGDKSDVLRLVKKKMSAKERKGYKPTKFSSIDRMAENIVVTDLKKIAKELVSESKTAGLIPAYACGHKLF